MKKFFFILLALASFKANAQTYQYVPFPEGNAVWSEKYSYENWVPTYYYLNCYDKVSLTVEDTIINSRIYKKLYLFNDSVFNINNAIYLGGIREENKKIYYLGDTIHYGKPLDCTNEVLLYDFNLNVGDTFYFGLPQTDSLICNNSYWNVVVISIDTINLGNKLRKRFIFNDYTTQWIEGIGNVNGLLLSIPPWIPGSVPQGSLICFKQNDTIVYFNSNFSECMPLNINENNVMNENILVFPNPANDYLIIKSGITQPFTYQLYNIQGILQKEGEVTASQSEINVADLPRGMYILKILTEKQIMTRKIVLK